jgi:hypothetical protein
MSTEALNLKQRTYDRALSVEDLLSDNPPLAFQQTIRHIGFALSDKAIKISSDRWMDDEKRLNLLGSRLLRAFTSLERDVERMTDEQVESEFTEMELRCASARAIPTTFTPTP